jgi:hypothetical protein
MGPLYFSHLSRLKIHHYPLPIHPSRVLQHHKHQTTCEIVEVSKTRSADSGRATAMEYALEPRLEPHGYETIEATQNRLDRVVLALNTSRNALQRSEASVREKTMAIIDQQRNNILGTDRSNERHQQSIALQVQQQRLATAERAIRKKLDQLTVNETQLLHAFRALEDRIVLDRAMKAYQVEEQQQQEEARARSEMITRLIEEQSRAVRQLQQEEDDEQKRKEQPRSTKESTSSATTKKKNTHKSNPDDGCSICLIPVRSSCCNDLFHSDH